VNDLKNTTALVRAILEKDEQCRNSDSFLYLKVLTVLGKTKGIDIDNISVPYFLMNLQGTVFPGFETVRRSRQKIQQHHPELAACKAVESFRAENEREFRTYALGGEQGSWE
jgi:hypothetical protein